MSGWPDHNSINTDHYTHWHDFMPIQKTKQKNLRKSPQFPHGDNLPSWAGQSCFTCHRQLATDNWSLTPSQPRWLYQCHRQIASYRQLVFNTQSAMMAISVSQTDRYRQLVFNTQSAMTAISVSQTDRYRQLVFNTQSAMMAISGWNTFLSEHNAC